MKGTCNTSSLGTGTMRGIGLRTGAATGLSTGTSWFPQIGALNGTSAGTSIVAQVNRELMDELSTITLILEHESGI